MNIIKIISESQLSKLLLCISGTKEVSITTETVVKMNKTNNPYFGKVRKQTKTSALINFDYESSVNRGLQKEGKDADFEAKGRAWGAHVPGTPLLLHKDKLYLNIREISKQSVYVYEDREIGREELAGWLPAYKKNENQGLENEVVVRAFGIDGIIAITVDGTDYIVTR